VRWNEIEIDKIAFHEVCELLLAELRTSAMGTFADDVVSAEDHRIIRRLENAVFPVTRGLI